MEKEYVHAIIILIGGPQLPGESIKQYLGRVSLYTDVDFYSVRDAYYTGRLSKPAKAKFERAAQSVGQLHDVITYLRLKLTVWERQERLRPLVDATRAYLVEVDRVRAAAGGGSEPVRAGDDRRRAAKAARLAATRSAPAAA